jgi:two-component system, OmpR family, response regulator QseB
MAPDPTSILVVEDHAEVAESVREILEEEGYTVEVAADGERALEIFPRLHPSLVLLDMRLPKIPGSELLLLLRAANAGTAIVAVTASAEVPREAAAVLQKPFDVDELLAVARRFCGVPRPPAPMPKDGSHG